MSASDIIEFFNASHGERVEFPTSGFLRGMDLDSMRGPEDVSKYVTNIIKSKHVVSTRFNSMDRLGRLLKERRGEIVTRRMKAFMTGDLDLSNDMLYINPTMKSSAISNSTPIYQYTYMINPYIPHLMKLSEFDRHLFNYIINGIQSQAATVPKMPSPFNNMQNIFANPPSSIIYPSGLQFSHGESTTSADLITGPYKSSGEYRVQIGPNFKVVSLKSSATATTTTLTQCAILFYNCCHLLHNKDKIQVDPGSALSKLQVLQLLWESFFSIYRAILTQFKTYPTGSAYQSRIMSMFVQYYFNVMMKSANITMEASRHSTMGFAKDRSSNGTNPLASGTVERFVWLSRIGPNINFPTGSIFTSIAQITYDGTTISTFPTSGLVCFAPVAAFGQDLDYYISDMEKGLYMGFGILPSDAGEGQIASLGDDILTGVTGSSEVDKRLLKQMLTGDLLPFSIYTATRDSFLNLFSSMNMNTYNVTNSENNKSQYNRDLVSSIVDQQYALYNRQLLNTLVDINNLSKKILNITRRGKLSISNTIERNTLKQQLEELLLKRKIYINSRIMIRYVLRDVYKEATAHRPNSLNNNDAKQRRKKLTERRGNLIREILTSLIDVDREYYNMSETANSQFMRKLIAKDFDLSRMTYYDDMAVGSATTSIRNLGRLLATRVFHGRKGGLYTIARFDQRSVNSRIGSNRISAGVYIYSILDIYQMLIKLEKLYRSGLETKTKVKTVINSCIYSMKRKPDRIGRHTNTARINYYNTTLQGSIGKLFSSKPQSYTTSIQAILHGLEKAYFIYDTESTGRNSNNGSSSYRRNQIQFPVLNLNDITDVLGQMKTAGGVETNRKEIIMRIYQIVYDYIVLGGSATARYCENDCGDQSTELSMFHYSVANVICKTDEDREKSISLERVDKDVAIHRRMVIKNISTESQTNKDR